MRPGTVAALVGLVLLLAVPTALSQSDPIWVDEGIFAYVAWASHVTGEPYYQAAYENKTPGIFWIYSLVQAYDQPGVARARVAGAVLLLGTALLLLYWVGRSLSPAAGIVASLTLVVVSVCMLWTQANMAAMTELPMVFFTALGFYCVYRGLPAYRGWWYVGAGGAFAAAFACKQIAVLEVAAASVAVGWLGSALARRARRQALGVMLLAYAGGLGLLALLMAATQQWPQFWESAVASLVQGSAQPRDAGTLAGLFLRAMWFPQLAPLFLLGLAGWLVGDRRLGQGVLPHLLLLWLGAAVLGVASRGSLLGHQALTFVPPLAALTGVGVYWLEQRWAGLSVRERAARAAVLLVLAGVPWGANYGLCAAKAMHPDPARVRDEVGLAQRLQTALPEAETLFAPDHPSLYAVAQRRAPTRYFCFAAWTTGAIQERAMADLRRTPPGVVLLEERPEREEFRGPIRREVLAGRYLGLGMLPASSQHEVIRVYVRQDLAWRFPSPPWPRLTVLE